MTNILTTIVSSSRRIQVPESKCQNMKITIIEKIKNKERRKRERKRKKIKKKIKKTDQTYREERETYFIALFNTFYRGLNKKA